MDIELKENKCIITPLSPIMNKVETHRLYNTILEYKNYIIAINLDNVIDCTIDFINIIKNHNNISIYNIQSDIFAIFNKMNIDKFANLYNSEIDFNHNSHKLLNRQFTLIANK